MAAGFAIKWILVPGCACTIGLLLALALIPSPPLSVAIALLVAICTVRDPTVAIWLSVPSGIAGAGYAPVLFAIAQSLAPARLRAMCSAVLILFITGAGMLIGPWAAGALSDVLAPRWGEDSLRAALVALIATMTLGVVALLQGARTLLDDLARARG